MTYPLAIGWINKVGRCLVVKSNYSLVPAGILDILGYLCTQSNRKLPIYDKRGTLLHVSHMLPQLSL